MTREREIEIISERFGSLSLMHGKLHNDTLKGLLKHYQKGFVEGVKWADENPTSPWISVEKDLPCNHEKLVDNSEYPSTCICVVLDEHLVGTNRMYKTNGKWEWGVNFPNVLYWFPLPKLPKRIRQIYD